MKETNYAYANEYHVGMTVRDKLAESAMIGMMSNFIIGLFIHDDYLCKRAYKIADKMLSQSNK